MSVAENYCRVTENIAAACIEAGRSTEDVKLIAVTKYVDTGRIAEAVAAGAKSVGENRVQEYREKQEFFKDNGLEVHLIGQLQTNKVKYIVGNGVLIQSVDRMELAKEISRVALNRGVIQDALIEVNIGGEAQKGGVAPEGLIGFLELVSALPNIRVKGLMCVPPAVGEERARAYFAAMRRLFVDIRGMNIPNTDMRELSMGMSGDYKAAILEGATMVRVGTGIFGARPGPGAGA